MSIQRTLCIIKPDAVEKRKVGAILERLEREDFRIVAMKRIHLTPEQARQFYAVHEGRPFLPALVRFMSRSPIVVVALEGENAITRYREVLGATDPANAAPGTLRNLYGTDVSQNAMHGSDSPETAKTELSYFFAGYEVYPLG